MEKPNRNRFQIGWWVFVGLAILTVIEFVLGAYVERALTYLIFTALIKAGLIIYYFMHISQIRNISR